MNSKLHSLITQRANELFVKVKQYREHIHQHPELSFEEFETCEYVIQQLKAIGISNIQKIGKTGVVALIMGDHHTLNDNFIGLRADLDALPIQEENNVSYKSIHEGKMHACGHDVHTSILLGTAEILFELRNELSQPIKLIFQPGEEKNPGGASILIQEGVLENPAVDRLYALHVFPELEAGKIGFKEGLYMASCDEIYVTIQGKGGHGAMPHQCIDPILIGSTIITSLQQIVSRACDPKLPCVLSFGHFEGIGATNVIPSIVKLKGTFRTMDEEWRNKALELIKNQIDCIAASFGGTAETLISKGYPGLINDEKLTKQLTEKTKLILGEENVIGLPIRLTSEDFAFYSQLKPVCFFRLGVGNLEKEIIHGVHHPQFNIDESSLITGMISLCCAVLD
jgi:amidohydrolase